MMAYQEQLSQSESDPILHIYIAACLFYMGQFKEAEESALKGPVVTLQNRLLFHIAHKFNDENKLMVCLVQFAAVKEILILKPDTRAN